MDRGNSPSFGLRVALALPVLCLTVPALRAQDGPRGVEAERFDDPPAAVESVVLQPRSEAMTINHNGYTSVQVNVDAAGMNVVGDAANEPSIAINPNQPNNIVIGWRQFDSVSSNFRQAGWAYSHNSGIQWSAIQVLEPGVARTDPVLDVGPDGTIHYLSLNMAGGLSSQLFRSQDGGLTWLAPAPFTGGDKHWMTVDRTGGPGDGNVYSTWRFDDSQICRSCVDCVPSGTCASGNAIVMQCGAGECCWGQQCCRWEPFARSVDGGASFEPEMSFVAPNEAPYANGQNAGLYRTTLAVGTDGEVYVAGEGFDNAVTWEQGPLPGSLCATGNSTGYDYHLQRSDDAAVAAQPYFVERLIPLGGRLAGSQGPNPSGYLGQPEVAVDHSGGPRHGTVYVLSSTAPFGSADPLDVHIVRSQDRGDTWTAPVRVNDDPVGNGAWQWFGTLSVSSTGRLDAVWNDTRNGGGDPSLSETFYAYSTDGGDTWSPNVAVTPQWNSHLGWPNQNKIGDYYDMVSDRYGASVAYAATFNGEQDVYHVRVYPDCNGNQASDVGDVDNANSSDVDGDLIPDECAGLVLVGPDPGTAGAFSTFLAGGGVPGDTVEFYSASALGSDPVNQCPGVSLGLANAKRIGSDHVVGALSGIAETDKRFGSVSGETFYFQAVNKTTCVTSNVVTWTFP